MSDLESATPEFLQTTLPKFWPQVVKMTRESDVYVISMRPYPIEEGLNGTIDGVRA